MASLLGEARQGDYRIRSSNGIPTIEETWHYTVQADYKSEPRIDVARSVGLILGVSTQSAGFTVCRALDGSRRESNPLIWDFTAEFSSEVEEGTNPPDSDPTTWVPVYETKFERIQEVVTKDQSGNAVANSAGQPYETGLTISRFIPVWEFYQFEPASVSDETIIERNETVNSGTFKGRAAKTLLCTVEESVLGFYYGQRRRLTKYSLKYNEKKWTHKRLDVGTVYLDSSVLKPYLDNEGNVILGPLDGSGAKQSAGTAPAIEEFDIFASDSFSFLRS